MCLLCSHELIYATYFKELRHHKYCSAFLLDSANVYLYGYVLKYT